MSHKQYYIVKNMSGQDGGQMPYMVMGTDPMIYGPPLLKPSLYPGLSAYEFRISAPNTPTFQLRLSPYLAHRLMLRFFEKQRFEKELDGNVKIEFVRPNAPQAFSIGYGPFFQGIQPLLTQPMPEVNVMDMAGRPMTNDEILRNIKKNLK